MRNLFFQNDGGLEVPWGECMKSYGAPARQVGTWYMGFEFRSGVLV